MSHKPKKPLLSLCMIVKNESRYLEQCLKAARPFVDEIVIVDTGSTDGTQDIARRYADIYDEIEWPGSFSVARNHSYDLASGRFIIVLDGDEVIENPSEWRRVRKALTERGIVALMLPVVNFGGADQLVAQDRSYQVRVTLNHPEIRMMGRVHNQISMSAAVYASANGGHRKTIEAVVWHYGYSYDKDRMIEKYVPRLPLLRAEYADPASPSLKAYYGFQLGVACWITGNYEEGARVLREIDYSVLSKENAFYGHLQGAQNAMALGDVSAALWHCNEMLTIDREEPVAYYFTGFVLMKAEQGGDGLLMMIEAYTKSLANAATVRFQLNEARVLNTLLEICRQIGWNEGTAILSAHLKEAKSLTRRAVVATLERLRTRIAMMEAA